MKKIVLNIFIFSMFIVMSLLSACSKHECTGAWTIVRAPTIISAGLQERCCEECGEITQQEIPAVGIEKGQELLTGTWSTLNPSTATSNDMFSYITVSGDTFNSYFYVFGTKYPNVTEGIYSFTDSTIVFKFPNGNVWGAFEYKIEEGQIKKLVAIHDDGSKDTYLRY